MKVEIDDELLAKEIAGQAVRALDSTLNSQDYCGLWYNVAIDSATREAVTKIVEKYEERICKAIVKLVAEKISKNITLAAILSALEKENM